jgi:beta-phosphoglucomutase
MVVFPCGLQADAVIFDFDGVIVDTEPLHYRAFQKVLEPVGVGFSWQEYMDIYMGFDDRDTFLEAFHSRGKTIDPSELHRLIDRKAVIFQDVIQDGVTAYPGVVPLIRHLHEASVPLAISSGALHSDIDPILRILDLSDCFEIIVAADDISKSKPDPECYRLAFEKLVAQAPSTAISQARTLAIEDTPAGIVSAKAAGLQVVAVTNSYSRDHIAGAARIVSSLEELAGFRVA